MDHGRRICPGTLGAFDSFGNSDTDTQHAVTVPQAAVTDSARLDYIK